MNSTKIVILVLILIAVIFTVFVARGTLSQEPSKTDNQSEARNFTNKNQAPDWSKTLQDTFAWLKPRLKIQCGEEKEATKCENLQSRSPIKISEDKKQPFRLAKFRVPNSSNFMNSVNICYRAPTAKLTCNEAKEKAKEAGDINFNAQSFDLPNSDSNDRQQGTIVVIKEGGEITITCLSLNPCKVDLVE
jgi:hypothetical protein